MKHISISLLLLTMFSCHLEDCPQGINQLPMYGTQKKCKEQLQADNDFLNDANKNFRNRHLAAKYYIDQAWDYFNKNQPDTAMMRFNQAWLLDSLNADIYWGYGNLLSSQQKFLASIEYFEKSIQLNSNNAKVWECASTSLGQLFFQTKDQRLLDKSIDYLKKSLSLNPNNAGVLGQLTAAYSYFIQKDSALKYLKETDKIDPKMINPEVRNLLINNQ